ncbi:hypothetical protein MNBD_IGNAVI01-2028 [hydrothermal vent metagenome]|uniref:Uncharacterized protein n=1 Tax=hydrothermal vent metagenome TaxID=652676 RepID=A0A3B1BET4_9ZZZZ
MKLFNSILFIAIFLLYSSSIYSQPEEKWIFTAKSQLYASPLVADICPNVGNETIISDSEARILRCISSSGEQIWEYDGQWKKRLSSGAALTWKSPNGNPLLIIGNGDGSLTCIDAVTGRQVWKNIAGTISWGNAIWADINGDGIDEAIAGSEDNGITAFNIDGELLWNYKGGSDRPILSLKTPIAASDINDDGQSEIFAADRIGVFCLNGDGTLKWDLQTGDEFNSAPVIADANLDGLPEVYCSSFDDNILFSINALNGNIIWQHRLLNKVDIYSGSAIAVGDISGDASEEILISDSKGYVYTLSSEGELLWIHTSEMETHSAITLGDVDGDGDVEVLVASGDHFLYSLNNKGFVEWRYKADLRLIYPATIVDIDNDGKTDILICGSDQKLRCLTLNKKYNPRKNPWSSYRFDAAKTGSSFNKRGKQSARINDKRELLLFGDFERVKIAEAKSKYLSGSKNYETRTKRPREWFAEISSGAKWQLDSLEKHSGHFAVKITTKDKRFQLGSTEIAVDNSLRNIDVSVWYKGKTTPTAEIVWQGANGIIRVDQLKVDEPDKSGWIQLSKNNLIPPNSASWFKLVLDAEPSAVSWWDDAHIKGNFEVERKVQVYVNQLGFELSGQKFFTASSNYKSKSASYEIVDQNDETVYSSSLKFRDRIKGAFGHDWGSYYWRGDFSQLKNPGHYRIKIILDGLEDTSWPFEIADNIYWKNTVRPAFKFFYYQRCGMEVPGFHKACHLDDAADEKHEQFFDLAGGWHDAGDYNKYYNAPYVLGLANAYQNQQDLILSEEIDKDGTNEILDEILWGADFSRRMIAPDGSARGELTSGWGYFGAPELETDNIPKTGDERPLKGGVSGKNSSRHTAAMAKVARITKENSKYIEAAKRGLAWAVDQKLQGPLQLSAAIDLYAVTGEEEYSELSKKLFDVCGLNDAAVAIEYDKIFQTDHSQQIREKLTKEADRMLEWSDNPFGFYTYGPKENSNFFGTPADHPKFAIGTDHYILDAVEKMGLAYLYNPNPLYLEFIYNQLNWILGNNPYGISLMEGVGSSFAPTYHHRYFLAGVPRGAVPGGIINGIVWKDIGVDTPYFDMSGVDIPYYASNEFWLPHNTNYLKAISVLQKILQKTSLNR